MSSDATRVGAPIAPAVTTAGTDGSVVFPRKLAFTNPVAPCIVHNLTGNGLRIRASWGQGLTTISAGPHSFVEIADGDDFDMSLGGRVRCRVIWVATLDAGDDLDDIHVRGWSP